MIKILITLKILKQHFVKQNRILKRHSLKIVVIFSTGFGNKRTQRECRYRLRFKVTRT